MYRLPPISWRDIPDQQVRSAEICPQTCGGCHQGRYISYRDSFHGQATDLGFKTAAVCSDCHTPHLNLPASDIQSSVHPDQLRQTCGQCHRDVPSGFLDLSILQSWRSMVPGVRDWRDLTAHLRYFLYQGSRPAFDRWTYWEKFDYFAVFWGVMIIGVSGLLLWFPVFFTEFLPGWILNAAQLIHSDEALLAVRFVLVFHLFHSHLRPENFPLDPVIFTGSVPLERFKMERPAEYRRLVSSGALERLRVYAPTKSRLIFTYLFGLIGMIIGVMLIAGILWGFLAY